MEIKTTLDDNKIITDCRIQDGTKVMVLGKKYDIEADVMYQKIIKIEENIISIQKKLSEVRRIITGSYYRDFFLVLYTINRVNDFNNGNFPGNKRSQGY